MKGILIDSDVLIELLRGRNASVRFQFESQLADSVPLFYSAVSAARNRAGARDSEAAAITVLYAFMTCLPADCGIAAEGGEVLKRFRGSHTIGLGDALIGATAVRHDLRLWTRNRKHYPDSRLEFFESGRLSPPGMGPFSSLAPV